MGLLNLFFKPKEPISEEERMLQEEAARLHKEAVRQLKDRALAIEAQVKAVAKESDFDTLSPVQFVKYARVLKDDDLIEQVVPAHYTNKSVDWDGPGHVLFLPDRFLFVADEWEVTRRAVSYRYKDIRAMEKKRGLFQSTVRITCEEGTMDGKPYRPDGGQDQFIFYLKWEYKAFSAHLEAYLAEAAHARTIEGAAELAAKKEAAAEKAMQAVRDAQEAAERAKREAEEAKIEAERSRREDAKINEIDKY